MFDLTLAVPVLVALVEGGKMAGLPTKYAPLLSIVLGAALFVGFQGYSFESVFLGIISGLSACGLYSGTKTTMKLS